MQRSDHGHKMTTGHPVVNLLSRILTHLTIVLAAVLLILFLIDQAKRGEMSFLCNQATKWMLFSLCVLSGVNSVLHLDSLAKLRAIGKYLELSNRRKDRGSTEPPITKPFSAIARAVAFFVKS